MGAIDEVIEMLIKLLSAWREVASKPKSQVHSERDALYQEKRAVGSGYISV